MDLTRPPMGNNGDQVAHAIEGGVRVMAGRWILSSGLELPSPDVPIFIRQETIDTGGISPLSLREAWPPSDVAQRALDTYRWAWRNAVRLLEEARILTDAGRHARARLSSPQVRSAIRMGWPALRRFADAIGPSGRAGLLRILEARDEERAAAIGRLHLRDDGELLKELLIGLEEKEWARQAVIQELRRSERRSSPVRE